MRRCERRSGFRALMSGLFRTEVSRRGAVGVRFGASDGQLWLLARWRIRVSALAVRDSDLTTISSEKKDFVVPDLAESRAMCVVPVIVLSRKSRSRVRLRNLDRLVFVWLMLPRDSECDHRGQARDRDPLASARLSGLLALKIAPTWRPPQDRPRDPRPHRTDEQGEPIVRSAADPRRTADARGRGSPINRGEV
jgi:hypothetical protein